MTDAAKIARGLDDPRPTCPHFEDHTPCPKGYLQWHAWAAKMLKTHKSRKCPGCDRYTIWEPRPRRPRRTRKDRR